MDRAHIREGTNLKWFRTDADGKISHALNCKVSGARTGRSSTYSEELPVVTQSLVKSRLNWLFRN